MSDVTPQRYAEIRVLADKLVASCDGGRDEADEVEALSLDECKVLDSMAFECSHCNQWYAVADRTEDSAGQWCCTDCERTDQG